ncbi:peptidoglycan bridge formation glycyltransferase FemA/FemB family protein [Patescibacteria group bacterium]|nr:peptidoglycan bridge formation glycyltransferase FemA/FemB family protein [Patescibacteria group bacterium]
MRIIQFKENQKEIWNEFVAENNSESFLQSWEWGNFQQVADKKIFRIGIKDNDEIIAVALIVKHDLPFGRSYLYCPRGPVVAESRIKNQELRIPNILFDEIKKIAKKEKSLFLRIDPPISRWFHSGNSPLERGRGVLTPLEKGEGCVNVEPKCKFCVKDSTVLKPVPYRDTGGLWSQHKTPPLKKGAGGIFKKTSSEIQPRDTLILNIAKSEEELLKEMKQKTRYNIRLAGKKGIRIMNYELGIMNQEEFMKKFESFWDLVEETSRRDKFASHSKDYYWKMLESLIDGDIKEAESPLLRGVDAERTGCVESTEKHTPDPSQEGNKELVANQFPRLQAKLYLAEYKNKIIAANIVLYFGDMAVYLHGASSNEHRNLMAPYLLQWQQITDAKKAGCKKYDFWGITINEEKKSWQGITKFKKGFGGYEKNYIGAYDLLFSNIGYRIYKSIKFVKHALERHRGSKRS